MSLVLIVVRTSCDTTSAGREKTEKTEESGSLSEAIFYVFARYLSKPLYCDYAVYIDVHRQVIMHIYLYARNNKQLVLGIAVARYSHEREGCTKLDMY